VLRVLPGLQLQAGLDLGVSMLDRTAQVTAGDLQRTPNQRTSSFLASPRLSALWTPVWYATLGISLGVDLLTMPTAFEVASPAGRTELERAHWARPWVTVWALGLSW
jgi:hypothetical protein